MYHLAIYYRVTYYIRYAAQVVLPHREPHRGNYNITAGKVATVVAVRSFI